MTATHAIFARGQVGYVMTLMLSTALSFIRPFSASASTQQCVAPHLNPALFLQAVTEVYQELLQSLPQGLILEPQDITQAKELGTSVGLTWYLSLQGNALPFGKGLSFFRCNEQGQICYIR